MTSRLSIGVARSTVAIGCTVMLALLSTRLASTQGASGTDQQVSALRQQLAALDRRVKDLEKMAVPVDAGTPDPATLAARIVELETKVRSLQSQVAAGVGTGGAQAATKILAPFVVVDRAGKPIMRVTDEADGLSRGIYMYNSNASVAAHIGVTGDGSGRIYVTMNGALPMAMMAVSSNGPIFRLGADAKKAVEIDKSSMVFYNDGGTPLSLFGTKDRGKGYMELNNSGGSKMVEAGMLNAGVGYVMANPSRSSVSPSGNPSVLMGGAGR